MQDFERGTVRANQLTFEYLTQGDGPLALCVHGFPDSPYSYRYLLPALPFACAAAGLAFAPARGKKDTPPDQSPVPAQEIDSGATSGVPISSWIWACAVSGMSRGLPR